MTTTQSDDVATRISALEAKLSQLTSDLNNLNGGVTKYDADGVNIYNYLYRDSIIYQDIFNAYNSNIFVKKGAATGWNEVNHVSTPWNLRRALSIGTGPQSNGNGILVNIPQGYNVLWLRVLNDRWATFRVFPNDGDKANFSGDNVQEVYAGGYRTLNQISPDGGSPDSMWNVHMWMPIPLRAEGSYWVLSDRNSDSWISGIAFGKNLWNHAVNSAVAYHWKLNPQQGDIGWISHDWHRDQLAYFPSGSNVEVSVPVVHSGKDKIIYFVEHNDNWTGVQHGQVFINGAEVERFRTSYTNPFAVHFNSKFYSRYVATRIPANLIKAGDKFVKLRVDMTKSNHHLHFREIGTHDYF